MRIYSVGFGDCIHVRIPGEGAPCRLLIDRRLCSAADTLQPAPHELSSVPSPHRDQTRRLVPLTSTRPHANHVKGFDPEWLACVQIGCAWLTSFTNTDRPTAWKMLAFQSLADAGANALAQASGIHPQCPRSVGREMASRLRHAENDA